MRVQSALALVASLALAPLAAADNLPYSSKLVGTWSTKSNKTLTGPGFFDPTTDNLIEPSRTGISYSFTLDGYYEEAYYRAVSNPQDPSCPSGVMQWQHGSYVINANNSLTLTPIAVDGRQLLSEPCTSKTSTYTRYNQSEYFAGWDVFTDAYHDILRLNLDKYDGSAMNPMYIAFNPPEMLPTTTLNPTTSSTAKATATSKVKRSLGLSMDDPVSWKMTQKSAGLMNPDTWWWMGLTMTGVGGLLYFGPRRMGIHI